MHTIKLATRQLAEQKGCTAGQLALAWVLAQGNDIVPIPGTKRSTFLEQNIQAAQLQLTFAELAEIDAVFPLGAATGLRYSQAGMNTVNR